MSKNKPLVLNEFLEYQNNQEKEMLFGIFKKDEDEEKVKLLLWIEQTKCFSAFCLEVPEDAIKSVEPTEASGFYAGQKLLLVKINFNQNKLNKFLTPEELFNQIRQNHLAHAALPMSRTDMMDNPAAAAWSGATAWSDAKAWSDSRVWSGSPDEQNRKANLNRPIV